MSLLLVINSVLEHSRYDVALYIKLDAADKPRHVGGKVNCQQALVGLSIPIEKYRLNRFQRTEKS